MGTRRPPTSKRAANRRLVAASAAGENGRARATNERRSGTPPAFHFPSELIDLIAERAAELLTGRARSADGWLRGAHQIAAYIDCPRSRVYALVSAGRIPIHHDGSALIARRSELDRWLREGGGIRP